MLKIDAARDRVDLLYAGEPLKTRLPMAADRVFRVREAALHGLERRATPPDVLADSILEAYDSLTAGAGGRPGRGVPLPKVHFELFVDRQSAQSRATLTKASIKEYPRSQFAWDLAGLLANPHFLERDGRKLELVPASPSAASSRSASIRAFDEQGVERAYALVRVG